MDFPIEGGPFAPTWSSILANYPTKDSAWLRQAKFGIWVHFGPQAAGNSGDWYARRMYIEATRLTTTTSMISAILRRSVTRTSCGRGIPRRSTPRR